MPKDIELGKEAERFIQEFETSKWKAREKFSDFCKSQGGLVFRNATYCKIKKPISRVDIQLVQGDKQWIAEFVGLEED